MEFLVQKTKKAGLSYRCATLYARNTGPTEDKGSSSFKAMDQFKYSAPIQFN